MNRNKIEYLKKKYANGVSDEIIDNFAEALLSETIILKTKILTEDQKIKNRKQSREYYYKRIKK